MDYAIRHVVSAFRRSFASVPGARLALAGLVFGLATISGASTPAADAPATASQGLEAVSSSSLRPEVRLRKLHLVRPDLIGYPLAYDIYC